MGREEVISQAYNELAEKSENFIKNLHNASQLNEEATQTMLREIDSSCEAINQTMEEDKQRQTEMLKKRLEQRKNRRAKLEANLSNV